MTALTDDEVVQIAREAVAELYAEHGKHPDNPEALDVIRSGKMDDEPETIFAIAGARAVAAKLSGGGGALPVGYADSRGLEDMVARRVRFTHVWDCPVPKFNTPLYATPPVEPAVVPMTAEVGGENKWLPLRRAIWAVVTGQKLNDGHYINAYHLTDLLYQAVLATPPAATGDMSPAVNLHQAYERERASSNTSAVVSHEVVDGSTQAAPGDDLVERLLGLIGYVAGRSNIIKEAAARITADAAVIEKLQLIGINENNLLRQEMDKVAAAEARITDLQAEVGRVAEQRDNLWMAYLHSRKCFYGGNGSTNPDQLAHVAVDEAIAGRDCKDVTALKVAKKAGRLGAALTTTGGGDGR